MLYYYKFTSKTHKNIHPLTVSDTVLYSKLSYNKLRWEIIVLGFYQYSGECMNDVPKFGKMEDKNNK